ncbi:PspA/IM30 family protein [Spartinivicinus ruber]|uniref:PspA/IM30 family protein n=1 Tax=Spartinivicinus ruber TaxID=2683272 RepID=UPI0013D214C2|nr:PspA/IM30 family protein [Spartinivicinus ruber]
MNILQKIKTAMRGKIRENAEQFIDANAIRIYQQELIDAESGLAKAKHYLSLVMAERIQLERSCQALEQQLAKREQQARDALNKDEKLLANELAAAIVEIEANLTNQKNSISQLTVREAKLTQQIQSAVQQIRGFSHQLQLIKATENSHKATCLVANQAGCVSTNISNLQESLSRIRQQQQHFEAVCEAKVNLENSLSDASLEEKLEKAGITTEQTKIDRVLNRLAEKY